MKNIKHYDKPTIDFYNDVVGTKRNSKNKPTYEKDISKLKEIIETRFNVHDNAFYKNILASLNAHDFNDNEKKILLELYSYNSSMTKKLKVELTTDESNRVNNTCQYCTIGEINTFDHFIPKTEFPEYTVNPLNLIPCCGKCNSSKSKSWRDEDSTVFLNLYIDTLPEVQYLFAKVNFIDNELYIDYELANIHGINDDLYIKIIHHYTKLDLLIRFKESSNKIISRLIDIIMDKLDTMPIDEIISEIESLNVRRIYRYGHNNREIVLENALINSSEFLVKVENGTIC